MFLMRVLIVVGLISKLIMKCKMCKKTDTIYTENPDKRQINEMAVAASVVTGIGYSRMEQICTTMDIPFMAHTTYIKISEDISKTIEDIAWDRMKDAGKEEVRLAVEAGDTNGNGIPIIPVIVDGAWSKRFYKINYNALSGVGCIIGARTKKVLFASVRNKYCCICSRNEKFGNTDHSHTGQVPLLAWNSTLY